MKNIFSAIKYLFKNIIAMGLFSLPAAIFFALKYNSTHFYNYILNIGNLETSSLIKIYSHFSLLPSFNLLMILFWSVLIICCLCLLVSYMERHLKYGIKSTTKAFKTINYSVMVIIPSFILVIGLEEFFAFINALCVKLITISQSSIVGLILPSIYVFFMLLLFLCYAMISMWIPIKTVTGYSNKDSIRYSIRLAQGKHFKIMAGLIFPFLITAPIMIILKHLCFIEILNTIVYIFCYVFILSYLVSFMMITYFDISGLERKDIKKKIF